MHRATELIDGRHGDEESEAHAGAFGARGEEGFAGTGFDPAHDHNSFVPYYLRAWALDENFNSLPTETKLKSLPRVPEVIAQKLKLWVAGIVPENLRGICERYGINPQPTLDRLQKLQVRVGHLPVDVVIDGLWVTT